MGFLNFKKSDTDSEVVASVPQVVEPTNELSPQIFESNNKPTNKVDEAYGKAAEVIGDALTTGIVHTVKSNEVVQGRVLKTADTVIDAQLNAIESKAAQTDKESFFEMHRDACTYFGYDETTTDKSHVKLMACWAWIFNTLYICTIGFFVVAPISFFFYKVNVVIKKQWVVLVLAFLIYLLIVLTPFIISWLGRL